MDQHLRNFVFVWLGPAWVGAHLRVFTEAEVKKFLSDAWDAYRHGDAAAEFGRGWMP